MNRSCSRFTFFASILAGIAIGPASILADTDELAAWEAAQQHGTSQEVFAFIEAYPNGRHTKEAKAMMIDLLWGELEDAGPDPASKADETSVVVREDTDVETQEIELKSADGLVALKGVIIDFDDAFISIRTSQGVIGIESLGISCIGSACPPELLAAR